MAKTGEQRMSKLIDADKLKAYIASNFVRQRKTRKTYYEDGLEVMEMVDKQDEVLLSCPKCHGIGTYEALVEYEDGEGLRYEPHKCILCKGTGKVTVEAYEEYQEECRR